MKLTEKLDSLLQERGLNRKEFSAQAGIPYMTVINFYKKGTDNIKLSTLKKISEFFNVSLDYIADDSVCEKWPNDSIVEHEQKELCDAEKILLEKYRFLNIVGKQKIDEYVNDLLESPRYCISDNLPMPDLEKIKEQFGPQIEAFRKNMRSPVKK